ncbi:MAG: MATE family efflux transporter [Candidatus Methanomethylophilaceae archaeon]|nr:MATE family efflux transporter [Candidatus Methanomethylophilaceae archaeon]
MAEEDLGKVRDGSNILRFTLPSIAMMLFISSYSIVDGAFISNFVGTDALASINIMMPVMSLLTGVGFMFATGGSAYIANLLGKGEQEKARGSMSLIVLVLLAVAIVFVLVAELFAEPLVRMLGADDTIAGSALEYAYGFLPFIPFLVLQFVMVQLLIVAGRPGMSLSVSVAGGLANIVLDYLLIVVLDMGLTGAAVASGIGSLVPSLAGALFFLDGSRTLHFTRPSKDMSSIASTCSNGISEMAGELSGGVTTLCYNLVMMSYIGPDGVSAITILSYVQFLALAAIIGYSNGIAPVMSFDHGAGDRDGMRRVFRFSLKFVAVLSVAIFVVMELFSQQIAGFFAEGSDDVMDITVYGARIFSFGFLLMGLNVYASSLFTSLSNGPVSALISLIRSLILLAPLVLLIPMAFGIDAIWYAIPVTELVTAVLATLLIVRYGSRYGYIGRGLPSAQHRFRPEDQVH